MDLELHLCALDPALAEAWSRHFDGEARVQVHRGDILKRKADAILSPANSFGFMDGGIDLAYSNHFGWELQDRLQRLIRMRHDGELPVGNAIVVTTHHADIPFLVSAPTMRVPMPIADTVNVFLAFRAALLAVREEPSVRSLLVPGLGTGIGAMPYERSARQMRAAYDEVVCGDVGWRARARDILGHHARLLG